MSLMQPVRGTRDLLPSEFAQHKFVSEVACEISSLYGFKEIDTPIFEFVEVFARTLGDTSDIVTKEMYTFLDKNGDKLSLRPEFTAGIVRMMMTNGLFRSLPFKVFGRGPMFRYERPQKGRQRQFHQINIELLGVSDPMADIEVIALGHHILNELGINEHITLELNSLGDAESRKTYRKELVKYFKAHKEKLSEESLVRLEKNPLRILDSKSESDKELIKSAPVFEHSLNLASIDFFEQVKTGLHALKIPFRLNPLLVRGMDYYCHTAFEFVTSALGSQNAVLAGGRYDGLVEAMGGPATPGIGWAGGVERLAMLVNKKVETQRPIAVVPLGDNARETAFIITHELRRKKFAIDLSFSGNLKKRLSRANQARARAAILIGDDELENESATIRDMETGEQKEVLLASLEESLARFR